MIRTTLGVAGADIAVVDVCDKQTLWFPVCVSFGVFCYHYEVSSHCVNGWHNNPTSSGSRFQCQCSQQSLEGMPCCIRRWLCQHHIHSYYTLG